MPLDSTDFIIETKPDLSKPSLEGLSWLLRQPLPANHAWNFTISFIKGRCGTAGCALGVGRCVWGDAMPSGHSRLIADYFKMPMEEYAKIFFSGGSSRYSVPDHCVTPQMVADRIDAYLSSRTKE